MAAFAVVAACPTVYFARLFFAHAQHPEYLIPAYAPAVVAVVLIAMGAAALSGLLARRGRVTALAALATAALVYGVLFVPLGVPLLLLAAVAGLTAARGMRTSSRRRAAVAAGSGIGISLGVIFVVMVGRHPPLVDCRGKSTSTSHWFWGGSPSRGSARGTATARPDPVERGSVSVEGETYVYICKGDALVSFRERP